MAKTSTKTPFTPSLFTNEAFAQSALKIEKPAEKPAEKTFPTAEKSQVLSVSALNRQVRAHLESKFPLCWVSGEISNLVQASSGHFYFSLKDEKAQVRAVMFKHKAQLLGFRLTNGDLVEAHVLVSLYEPRGEFQLTVENVRKAGQGSLFERFLLLKEKLTQEGVFSPEKKRPLPKFPRTIGIITSPQAAALHDVMSTLKRRAPQVNLILYPAPVQGKGVENQLANAIKTANARNECDALLLCRGGGSLEDLWAFNEEILIRAISASHLPIISGIGHETDFTLADFAADCRAPTPTAAAEMIAPAHALLQNQLDDLAKTLRQKMRFTYTQKAQALDRASLLLKHPLARLRQHQTKLDTLNLRMQQAIQTKIVYQNQRIKHFLHALALAKPNMQTLSAKLNMLDNRLAQYRQQLLQSKKTRLTHAEQALLHLNPQAVLARGYSVTRNAHHEIVRNSHSLEQNAIIMVTFASGSVKALVETVHFPDNKL